MLTYGELKQQVLSYLDYEDDEIKAQLEFFIDVAEKEIARVLRVPFNEKIVELRYRDEKRNTVNIPEDYIESKHMLVKETYEVIKMSELDFLFRKMSGIDKSTEGSGRYYARMGNDFIIYPPMPEGETILFNYYQDPSNMRNDSDSSYLLTIAPALILYLALKNALVFLKNDEDAAKYNALAQNELEQVRTQIFRMDNKPSQKVVPRRF